MLQYRENFKLYEKVFTMFMYTLIKHLGNQAASIHRTKKAKVVVTLQIFKHAIYHLSQIAI